MEDSLFHLYLVTKLDVKRKHYFKNDYMIWILYVRCFYNDNTIYIIYKRLIWKKSMCLRIKNFHTKNKSSYDNLIIFIDFKDLMIKLLKKISRIKIYMLTVTYCRNNITLHTGHRFLHAWFTACSLISTISFSTSKARSDIINLMSWPSTSVTPMLLYMTLSISSSSIYKLWNTMSNVLATFLHLCFLFGSLSQFFF